MEGINIGECWFVCESFEVGSYRESIYLVPCKRKQHPDVGQLSDEITMFIYTGMAQIDPS